MILVIITLILWSFFVMRKNIRWGLVN